MIKFNITTSPTRKGQWCAVRHGAERASETWKDKEQLVSFTIYRILKELRTGRKHTQARLYIFDRKNRVVETLDFHRYKP